MILTGYYPTPSKTKNKPAPAPAPAPSSTAKSTPAPTSIDAKVRASPKYQGSKYTTPTTGAGGGSQKETINITPTSTQRNLSQPYKEQLAKQVAAERFRSSTGASIVSGNPAGYALAKNQYIGNLLERQAQAHEQKNNTLPPATLQSTTKQYEATARGALDRSKDYLSQRSAMFEISATRSRIQGKQITGAGQNIASFGLGFAAGFLGFASSIAHPVQTAKGIYYGVTHPMETGQRAGEALATRPVQSLGETAGSVTAAYATSKVIGKGIEQWRAAKKPTVTSSAAGKTFIKTKQVAAGSNAAIKTAAQQTAKTTIKIGKDTYKVNSLGRSKGIISDTGRVVETGKVQHTINRIMTAIPDEAAGAMRTNRGASRYVTTGQRLGDKLTANTAATTAVKIKPGVYARAQDLAKTKGALVLQAENDLSITRPIMKGIKQTGAKTIKALPTEQWQYKTLTTTTKTQKVGKIGAQLRKIKPVNPDDIPKILGNKRPTSASLTTQTRTKGIAVTRETFDTKTPAVYQGKTKTFETFKGKTIAQSIPKTKIKIKPAAIKMGKVAKTASKGVTRTTGKMLLSKKAQLAENRPAELWPQSPNDLQPEAPAISLPKTKIRPATITNLQGNIFEGAKSAARLAYIYKPTPSLPVIGAVMAGGTILGKARPLTGKDFISRPLDRTRAGPEYISKNNYKPAEKTQPVTTPKIETTAKTTPETSSKTDFKYFVDTPTTPAPLLTVPPSTPFIPPLLTPPFIEIPPLPRLDYPGGADYGFMRLPKKGRQRKGYTPSATAAAFGITGKFSKSGSKTGLGLRPIVIKKRKARF